MDFINESERFAPLIYNNLKGSVVSIEPMGKEVYFGIELDKVINELDAESYDFELMDVSSNENSVIRFSVTKRKGMDEDDDTYSNSFVPC